jgi:HK97 family phage portal protein
MSWRTKIGEWALGKQAAGEVLQTMVTRVSDSQRLPSRGTAELVAAFRTSPWLRAVVSKIAFHFASTPWKVLRVAGPNGRAQRFRSIQDAGPVVRRRLLKQAADSKRVQEIVDHPLVRLLGTANPAMTGLNARRLTQTYLEIKGEAFWILERDRLGTPVEYWPIPPNWISRTPSDDDPTFEMSIGGTRRTLPAEDVVWFRELDPSNPFGRGIGLGESLGDEIETDEYTSKMLKSFFLNRGKPDLLVAVKGAKEPELKRAKAKFEEQHRGFWKAFRSFWHSGEVTVHELQTSFNEMQLSNLRTWERDIVVNVFGVPPEVLGILANSNRATVTESLRIFASEVLIPRLEFMRAEMQAKLVPLYDERIVLDYESPMPDDEELRLKALALAPWAIDRGEWRQLVGFPDRGKQDRFHYTPAMLIPENAPVPEDPEARQLAAPAPLPALPPHVAEAPAPETKIPGAPIDENMVQSVLAALRPDRLTRELRPLWDEEFVKWGQGVLRDLGIDPSAFDIANPLVARHLAELSSERVTLVTDTIKEALRDALTEGVQAGEGIPDLARRVQDVFDASRARATVIARTEVVRSSNYGTWQAHRLSGVVERRQWIATPDDRTREEHADLDGEVVGIDEPFESGGSKAMAPGDFGVPELDIQCRCTTVAVIGEPKEATVRVLLWKAYERERRPWELMTASALKRAFKLQEKDVLDALEDA